MFCNSHTAHLSNSQHFKLVIMTISIIVQQPTCVLHCRLYTATPTLFLHPSSDFSFFGKSFTLCAQPPFTFSRCVWGVFHILNPSLVHKLNLCPTHSRVHCFRLIAII